MQGILDVVSRAAMEGAVRTLDLVDLCQGALHKTRGTADEGNDPHPEYGAGTAGNDGDGHTGDIADTDAGSRADTECLEGADRASLCLCADAFCQETHHFRQHPELHEFRGQGEVNAAAYEDHNEHIGPQQGVDTVHHRVQ